MERSVSVHGQPAGVTTAYEKAVHAYENRKDGVLVIALTAAANIPGGCFRIRIGKFGDRHAGREGLTAVERDRCAQPPADVVFRFTPVIPGDHHDPVLIYSNRRQQMVGAVSSLGGRKGGVNCEG